MSLLIGVNHIATVSRDLDRLIAFYDRVFEARLLLDVEVPHIVVNGGAAQARHVFIELGGPSVLHAWQIENVDPAQFDGEIFGRGRIDHLALAVGSYADFERLRQRLLDMTATSGEINDFGVMTSFSFEDPDGMWGEVCWWKDGPDLNSFDASLVTDPIAQEEARDAR